jgi:hypothetical protein
MRGFPFLAASVLVLAATLPLRAQQAPPPAQADQAKKIWTNDDMDELRARGLISIVGQETEEAPQAPSTAPQAAPESATAPAQAAAPEGAPAPAATETAAVGPQAAAAEPEAPEAAPYDRTQDPMWYAEQAAELQAQLDGAVAALSQAQQGLALASSRITQPGINLTQPNVGITPQAGIEILAARVRELQSQLDDLANLARQNDIPPGVLRG